MVLGILERLVDGLLETRTLSRAAKLFAGRFNPQRFFAIVLSRTLDAEIKATWKEGPLSFTALAAAMQRARSVSPIHS